MALLVLKAVAMIAIVAAGATVLCLTFMPRVERIVPSRRRALASRMVALLVLAPLAFIVLQTRLLGERHGYLDALFWSAPLPAGYLLCLAVLAVRERVR